MREILLPSGRVAVLGEITWWDKAVSANQNLDLMILALACRVVKINKKPLSLEEARGMTLVESLPIINAVTAALVEAMGLNKPEATPEQQIAQLH